MKAITLFYEIVSWGLLAAASAVPAFVGWIVATGPEWVRGDGMPGVMISGLLASCLLASAGWSAGNAAHNSKKS